MSFIDPITRDEVAKIVKDAVEDLKKEIKASEVRLNGEMSFINNGVDDLIENKIASSEIFEAFAEGLNYEKRK